MLTLPVLCRYVYLKIKLTCSKNKIKVTYEIYVNNYNIRANIIKEYKKTTYTFTGRSKYYLNFANFELLTYSFCLVLKFIVKVKAI